MKKIILITFLICYSSLLNAQEFSDVKKQTFIFLELNAGSDLVQKSDTNNYQGVISTLGLGVKQRITNKIMVNTGFRYNNIYQDIFHSTSTLTTSSFSIPLTFEFPILLKAEGNYNSSKTNNKIYDLGFFLEIGGYYSFNNTLSSSNENFIEPENGSNFGGILRLTYAWRGSIDFYLEGRTDITPFLEKFDPDYKRLGLVFGMNIYLFSF